MQGVEYCDKCGYIKQQCECEKPQTNADRIRSMTDEELAEWLHNIAQFDKDEEPMVSIYDLDKKKDIEMHDSYGDLLEWLQNPVEV